MKRCCDCGSMWLINFRKFHLRRWKVSQCATLTPCDRGHGIGDKTMPLFLLALSDFSLWSVSESLYF